MNFFISLFIILFFWPFAPLMLLVSYDNLFNCCNFVTTGKILSINKVDSFQCDLNLYLNEYNKNITINDLSCFDLSKSDSNITIVSVFVNHNDPNKCKKLIISDGYNYKNSYKSDSEFFQLSKISFIFFVVMSYYNDNTQTQKCVNSIKKLNV